MLRGTHVGDGICRGQMKYNTYSEGKSGTDWRVQSFGCRSGECELEGGGSQAKHVIPFQLKQKRTQGHEKYVMW